MRLDRSREASQEGPDSERQDLQSEDVDAHRLGGALVLTDGDPPATDPAVVEPDEDEDHEGDEHQQQEVVVAEPAQGDAGQRVGGPEVEPEEVQVRDAGDAVGAVGEVRTVVPVEVEHREPEDLTETQGDDGEVVAGDPQCR